MIAFYGGLDAIALLAMMGGDRFFLVINNY